MENALPVYVFSTLSGLGIPLSPVCCFLLKQNGPAVGGLKYTGRSARLSVMLSFPTSSRPPCILALRGDSGERGKMNRGGVVERELRGPSGSFPVAEGESRLFRLLLHTSYEVWPRVVQRQPDTKLLSASKPETKAQSPETGVVLCQQSFRLLRALWPPLII